MLIYYKITVLIADDVDRQKFYWTRRFFWQYAGQSEGFSALSTVLESDDLPHKQRLKFANDVTKLIHQLHDKKVFQQDLKLDDIFVAVTTLVIFHLIQFLRVKEIKIYEKSMLLYSALMQFAFVRGFNMQWQYVLKKVLCLHVVFISFTK